MELIPVTLNGVYTEVHPTALAQHKALGWRECEKQESDEPDEAKSATKAELQALLDEKGVAFKPTMNKAELQALLDAA